MHAPEVNPARNPPAAPLRDSYGYSYGNAYRRRRCKTDWAGLGIGDAFKPNMDYFMKLSAQRLFYNACRKIQIAAALAAGVSAGPGFQPKTKPQLGPCYTNYPAALAAYCAVGLTGFLEFQTSSSERVLRTHMAPYLQAPATHDQVSADPEFYKKLAEIVTKIVQTRLLLEDLSRQSNLALVEFYRLFAASQHDNKFESLPDIINAVVLYGDVLPDWKSAALHPLTCVILKELHAVSLPFFDQLVVAKPHELAALGVDWVRAVCKCLAPHLPEPRSKTRAAQAPPSGRPGGLLSADAAAASEFARRGPQPGRDDALAPLNGPNPPTLFEPLTAAERAASFLNDASEPEDAASDDAEKAAAMKILQEFSRAAGKAAGQEQNWEDMRSDLVERALKNSAFAEGPLQGSPTDGHEVRVRLGADDIAGGEIYDRPVELSHDFAAYEQLLGRAQPITEALRRTLYPNVEEMSRTERFRTTGALDLARIAMVEFSSVIFKRNYVEERADRRGKPVLLIACDGSGSLNCHQMQMLKVLTTAWLASTARSSVQVIAGLYHSGTVRGGLSGPLVQWIHHPRKTPAISRTDAARAVVSLPEAGTGAQSDALSIAFMLEEARRLARCRMIYLILVSDCQWNRSFSGPQDGKAEVLALFENAYQETPGRLHTTLVALGVDGETGFEHALQKVITVPAAKLEDYMGTAEKISVYVASCIRERHRFLSVR